MNRLIIKDFNISQKLESNDSILLLMENKKYFYNFITDIQNDLGKEFINIVDNTYKVLKTSDYIDIIPSLFYLDINCKRNLNSINKQVKLLYRNNIIDTLYDIKSKIESTFSQIKMDYPIDIISDCDLDEEDIIKLLNIKIDDTSKTILEKIMIYIKVAIELRKIKIFIFVNLFSYLEKEEIDILLKNCKFLDIILINIESQVIENNSFDIKKMIDNDICLIE